MRGTQLQKLLLLEAFFMENSMKKIWKIESVSHMCESLGYKEELINILDEKDKYYKNIVKIPKKMGYREICMIDKSCSLYELQKSLKINFLDNIKISDIAYGFKKNYDYFDFLETHRNFYGNANYLRIDISNFFGSISEQMIIDTFEYYVDSVEKEKILKCLLDVMLYNGVLIQGTPIAPVVSNIIFRSVDIRIQRYCDKQRVMYSRYVDDLMFSSEERGKLFNKDFCKTIERILQSEGFKINYSKLRRAQNSISINGFCVDENVRLSRKKLAPISRILYYMERHRYVRSKNWILDYNDFMEKYIKEKNVKIEEEYELINLLAGYRAFLINTLKHSEDEHFVRRTKGIIKRIEKQIDNIEQLK